MNLLRQYRFLLFSITPNQSERMSRISKSIKILRDQFLLFRSSDFIAINKPSGFSASAGQTPSDGIQSLLKQMELVKKSMPIPVNSLGAETSGVVLLSLNSANGKLSRQMIKNGAFWKCSYLGIVRGRLPLRMKEGIINIPLKRDGGGLVPTTGGETTITHWRLKKYSDNFSLIEFEPRTDVPGQIRAHTAMSLRCPIANDHVYDTSVPEGSKSIGLPLHLHKVEASLPGGEYVTIRATPIGVMAEEMTRLGWSLD